MEGGGEGFGLCIKGSEGHIMLPQYTVVFIRVGYFVLLNYSYKSWSIIKSRDSSEICSS